MSVSSINTLVHLVQQLSSVNQTTPQESFKEKLNQWANKALLSAIENRNRVQAQDKFLEFMNTDQDSLVLSYLNLNSLPNIFDFEFFQKKIKDLDLSHNNLQTLPESFSNLQTLKRLDLGVNRFTSLPEAIGRLQNLEELVFSSNRLTSLPEFFSSLQALRRLDLDGNRFTSFPGCLNNLPRLNRVSLESNSLTNLSEFLPNNLQQLERLDLGYNRALSDFPMSILQLSSRCMVDLTGCRLSQGVLRRIGEEIMASNYTGPFMRFSWNELISNQIEEKSTEESLEDLYKKANQPLTTFPSAEESVKLRSWLSRLSSMVDYQTEGGIQKTLANKVIGYLNLTREDPAFRDSFYEIIEDASGSCGDKMSLSILCLGIAYQLITIDTEDMKALSNFLLKGLWTLEMLGKLARDKIDSLRFFNEIEVYDEIEVYLGYPIKLKQELEIPIDVEEMLYFDCSALTAEDLQKAKDFVLSQRGDEALCFKFLINHDKWKRALESKYPREFQRAKTHKNAALEAEDGYGYKAIKKEFNRSLVDLTRRALS